ncbi:MAG: tetratricopeptide repeat protein [Gemmataceae bacterium]
MARLACVVQPTPAGVSVTWSDGPAAFAPYELPARPLAAAADAARAALGAVVEGSFTDDGGDGPAAAAALAAAGYGLYQALFKPPAEQMALASEVRKWLDTLQAEGAVEGLEVVAEGGPAVPWNLVYDRRPDPAAFKAGGDDPARWRPFWGLRYDLAGGRRVSPLRRLPVLHNPRVVVVTDPLVLDRLPTESRELAALCQEHGWAHARTRQELADALQAGRPDLLYWLGHTQTDPFGLVLGDDAVTPDDLKTMLEGDPFADAGSVFGGVAFLNACGTAVAEKSGSFLDALHPLGLTGYVATEQVTVDTFAAPLGREFLTAFAVRGEPLGKVMRQLRGQVPLGLLYGSYCPSAVHVRREPRAPADAAPIVLTQAAVGTKLRRDPTRAHAETHPLPPQPYRSLQAYGPADRALFAGRDDDTLRFAQLLDEPGTRLVILHGESGVGKTSFLRAGVVPFLERECVGYRFARDRSRGDGDTVLLVRATNDPVAQIAAALTTFCAAPLAHRTPAGADAAADLPGVLRAAAGAHAGRDALRDALQADPGLLGRLLAELGRVLPFTPVLVIDQAEEVFTLARTPADEANRARALEMLRRAAGGPGGFKVVVSLRTEYHGRLTDKLRKGSQPGAGVRDYLLTDFGQEALTEVIRRPTSPTPVEHAAEIPAEKYGFRFAAGVAEDIARRTRADSINRSDSVLPLVQVVCSQLYDRVCARTAKVVTAADLEAIGGVEGGMRAHAETLVGHLFPHRADQRAFKRLLADPSTQLFIRQADGTLTTALLPAAFLARHWRGRMPFEEVLRTAGAGDRRLVRVNSLRIGGDEEEQRYVSLGHDALAKVAARWQEEQRRWVQVRKVAAVAAAVVVVAGTVFALQARAARKETELAQTKLAESERHEKARAQFAALFARAERTVTATPADAVPWDAVAADLRAADELAKADPAAFADWPLKPSADQLLARADAARADTDRREKERGKLTRLARHHRDAVFFNTRAAGLAEAETHGLVRAAAAAGLKEVGVDLAGSGPPGLAPGYFTPAEVRLATHRSYELLLIDAHAVALAAPAPGETAGERKEKVRDALKMLDRADLLLPAGTRTRVGLTRRAEYLKGLGEKEAAAAARAAADATPPVLAADHYLIGLEHHRLEEYTRAIPALGEALRAEPEHYGAQFLLAVCFLQDKRPLDAKLALDRCLGLRPDFLWPLVYRASAEVELGEYPKAEATLKEAIEKGAGDDAVHYAARTNRGVLAYKQRDWAAAVADLTAAVALRPDALPARINLALTHSHRAEELPLPAVAWELAPGGTVGFAAAAAGHRHAALDAAADVLDKAIELQPRVARLYHERVHLHLLRGDAAAAGKDSLLAVQLAPNLGRASTLADDLMAFARLKHQARQFKQASDAYGVVLRLPDTALTREKRALAARHSADALLAGRQYDGAVVAIDMYLALTPAPEGTALPRDQSDRLASALHTRGVILAAKKDHRGAIESFTRSLVYAPADPEVLTLRGSAYLASGATALAVADFDEALGDGRSYPDALLGRAEARVRTGLFPEALADAEAAAREAAAATDRSERKRQRYTAARVVALVVLGDPNTDDAPRRVARVAALLRAALADVEPAGRVKFWQDFVLADTALVRLSTTGPLAALATELGANSP